MKIIEAMKTLKALNVKVTDLRAKIAAHSADLEHESPVYGSVEAQSNQIKEWLQSTFDTAQEIARLRVAIQRTNLATDVTIELGGKQVTKSIAEWIHRRRDLAMMDMQAWASLTDRGLKDAQMKTSSGELMPIKVRRYFDPARRDTMVALFRDEPGKIDGTLEVVNAVTDLIE